MEGGLSRSIDILCIVRGRKAELMDSDAERLWLWELIDVLCDLAYFLFEIGKKDSIESEVERGDVEKLYELHRKKEENDLTRERQYDSQTALKVSLHFIFIK